MMIMISTLTQLTQAIAQCDAKMRPAEASRLPRGPSPARSPMAWPLSTGPHVSKVNHF